MRPRPRAWPGAGRGAGTRRRSPGRSCRTHRRTLSAGGVERLRSKAEPALDLEPADAGDEAFVRCLATYWLELGIAPTPAWAAGYIERARQEQGGPRHTFWASLAGRRVGFGMVRVDPDWLVSGRLNGYICEFYVFPHERRRGVGRALARRLIAFLREQGASAVELDVLPDNRIGMAFWKSLGFALSHHHLRLQG